MNPKDFLPAGLALDDAIAVLAAIAAFIVTAVVWQALFDRDPLQARLKALAARRDELRTGLIARAGGRTGRARHVGMMREVVQRLNLLRSRQAETITAKLARAGWRSRDAVVVYLFARLALPFVFGGVGLLAINGLHLGNLKPPLDILAVVGCVLLGAMAADIFIKNAAAKRRTALQRALPDALDLLVICAEAGLSLDAALTRVARELGKSSPELADEFGLTAVELTFLPDRHKALDNLNMRTDMPAIRGVVNTLKQTEKYGTPLAQSLRVLAAEFRNERLLKAEEKAARLPAILTVPMIIFILPALFVVLIGPAILKTIDSLRGL